MSASYVLFLTWKKDVAQTQTQRRCVFNTLLNEQVSTFFESFTCLTYMCFGLDLLFLIIHSYKILNGLSYWVQGIIEWHWSSSNVVFLDALEIQIYWCLILTGKSRKCRNSDRRLHIPCFWSGEVPIFKKMAFLF